MPNKNSANDNSVDKGLTTLDDYGQTDGRTDRHGFGILTWKHVDTQKISTQSSKLVVSCRSLYASPEDPRGCIIGRKLKFLTVLALCFIISILRRFLRYSLR